MNGITLDNTVVTGMKAGIGDSIATLQTTLNNAFLTEIAVMLIGFSVMTTLVLYILKAHGGTSGVGAARAKAWIAATQNDNDYRMLHDRSYWQSYKK
jgi:hypothetical protein